MSNSPLICYTKISPNKTKNRGHAIDTITIHCMAGNLTVEVCGQVFQNTQKEPVDKRASSNYGIGSDGRIAMYVEEKDRSWCSSNSANDARAITIEVANITGGPEWKISDQAYASLINLVVDVCQRNGIKSLKWSTSKSDRVNHNNGCNMTVHRDFAKKACPGDYLYNNMGKIAADVNARLSTPVDKSGATKFVTNLYVNALNRQPDATGLQNWVNQLVSGKTGGANVAQGIVFSQECINRNLNNDAWVTMLYPAVLGRPADDAGKKNWINQLNSGVTRDQVFYNFVTSPEFDSYCKSCGISTGKINAPKSSAKPTQSIAPTVPQVAGPTVIKPGDTVKIAPTAKYYNSTAMPSWVKNLTWRVASVSGDRVVLGKSTNGKYNINSPVNKRYLTKI